MTRLTTFVLAHKRLVLLAWLLLAVIGFATIGKATGRLSTSFSIPGKAFHTDSRIESLYHSGGFEPPIVLTATAPPGTSPSEAAHVENQLFTAAAGTSFNSRLADQANTGAKLTTTNGQTAYALVFVPLLKGGFNAKDPAVNMGKAMTAAAPAGWQTGVTGLAELESGSGGGSGGTNTLTETVAGGLGALVVLGFVFASFIALLPLLMAIVAIPTTFLLVLGLTEITSVSFIVEFLIALIGLGVAIDYSLLVVTRWREGVANGLSNEDAVLRAMEHAGRAVVFSGVTVAISLLALVVLPVSFLRSMGIAGFFIPLVSVAVAVTLLPVLLATVGPKVDRPRIRHEIHASRPWTLWAKLVLHYRVVGTVLGAGILVALLIPLTSLHLGEPSPKALAQKGSYHATLDMLQAGGVPNGVLTPIEVLTTAQAAPAVADAVRSVPGVVAAFATVEPNPPGGTGIVDILPAAEPSTASGAATVTGVTHVLAGMNGVLGIGGDGPSQSDFISTVYGQFPLMLGLIAVVTFLLLTRAFRSIVLALKAVIFNVASVGAAFGVTVVVWQWGHGSQALWNIPATGSITVWVPMMVFAFLFGLSMDYEVFILTRMREEYDRVGSTDAAVVTGIGRTGRLVTSAALILFLAFLAMSTAPDTDVKVLATGLGAGILLDALVVRSLLVPALVGVLGKWNWYLPDSVARLMLMRPQPEVAPVT